jgi:hypothetical protein
MAQAQRNQVVLGGEIDVRGLGRAPDRFREGPGVVHVVEHACRGVGGRVLVEEGDPGLGAQAVAQAREELAGGSSPLRLQGSLRPGKGPRVEALNGARMGKIALQTT